jgi:tRNA threonylcarbamoyladenosine modification (KEOPS) complex  Pcc1 subunit
VPTISSQRRFSAAIELTTRNAEAVFSAVEPDIKGFVEGSSTSHVKLIDDKILLDIESNDLSHLRASLNSYLRLMKTAINCLDITL